MARRKSSQKKKKAAKKVSPIPKAFHAVTPGLAVRDAAQAIEFYKRAFGAKEKGRMPGPDGKLMHANIVIGDSHIMMGEENVAMGNPSPLSLNGSPVSLYVYVKDADKVFNQAVKEGASVAMPMMDQFWGDRAGMVTDPYGHKWWLATHKRDLTPAQMKKAAEEFFASMKKQ
ncbi:VOC family protein [Nitrososphaera sp.]|uniref:VOC family protein n=1 Tax=Nitrososphaera sp. TaxID=1971748 RepID=UPI0017C15FDC|nr:VOC family protein [Nitrososphaera sp.]NWG38160.1 VOC family protein [Nitrososphaera sp.]